MKTALASRSQRGVSLIEVMISVFIFSVGVLGFASLQSNSLQATFDNGQRDQIIWLTQSLIDRVRLNSTSGALTRYDAELTNFGSSVADCVQPAPLCDAAACTEAEMATYDVWDLYCSNSFQGVFAIKGLSVNMTCSDGACDTNTENINLTTTWCARGAQV